MIRLSGHPVKVNDTDAFFPAGEEGADVDIMHHQMAHVHAYGTTRGSNHRGHLLEGIVQCLYGNLPAVEIRRQHLLEGLDQMHLPLPEGQRRQVRGIAVQMQGKGGRCQGGAEIYKRLSHIGGALALAGLLCLVSLLQSVALRRISGVQADAG